MDIYIFDQLANIGTVQKSKFAHYVILVYVDCSINKLWYLKKSSKNKPVFKSYLEIVTVAQPVIE